MMTMPTKSPIDSNNDKIALSSILCLSAGGRDNVSVWGDFRRIAPSEVLSTQGGNPIAIYRQISFTVLNYTVLYFTVL